ncbi:MAG: TnsA endonuclease N-terminal domain-containing protein, partial [Nitrososphaera sp.]
DFVVEYLDGKIELVEMKGEHLLNNPVTRRKMEFAKKWCDARGIKYRIYSKYQ